MSRGVEDPVTALAPAGVEERRRTDRRQADRRAHARTGGPERRRWNRRAIGAGLIALAGLAALRGQATLPSMGGGSAAVSEPAGSTTASSSDSLVRAANQVIGLPPAAEAGPAAPSPGAPESHRTFLASLADEAGRLYGVSADLVRAIIQVESAFEPVAVSRVGAVGPMQLMPATARSLGVTDLSDARQNVLAGTKYLRTLLDRFNGNTALAVASYNAGPTAVERHRGVPPYRETRQYVRRVGSLLADTDSAFAIPASLRAPAHARSANASVTRSASKKQTRASATRTKRASSGSARGARSNPRGQGRRA